jgi:hypothetical protein
MIGMVLNQHLDSIAVGTCGDGLGGQGGVGASPRGSQGSCSSCGSRIENYAALCPWCGRVLLKDSVFESEGAPT